MGVLGDHRSGCLFSIEIGVGVLDLDLLGTSGDLKSEGLLSIEEGSGTHCGDQGLGDFGDILVHGSKLHWESVSGDCDN